MNEQANRPTVLQRVFAVGAGAELAERLDAFSPDSKPRGEHLLRSLAVKSFTLTNDIDRGEYGTGEGLRLKQYERSLQQLSPPRHIRIDSDPERKPGVMALKTGALLRLFLDLNESEEAIAVREPMFERGATLDMYYFIPRRHLVGDFKIGKELHELKQSVAEGESFAVHPRLVDPKVVTRWPDDFTPRERPVIQRPAA